jgi:hypothetical protein
MCQARQPARVFRTPAQALNEAAGDADTFFFDLIRRIPGRHVLDDQRAPDDPLLRPVTPVRHPHGDWNAQPIRMRDLRVGIRP